MTYYDLRHEDGFNAWVSSFGRKDLGLNVFHAPDDECWMIIVRHDDVSIKVHSMDEVEELFRYAKKEGFNFRSWNHDVKDSRGRIVGNAVMFVFEPQSML